MTGLGDTRELLAWARSVADAMVNVEAREKLRAVCDIAEQKLGETAKVQVRAGQGALEQDAAQTRPPAAVSTLVADVRALCDVVEAQQAALADLYEAANSGDSEAAFYIWRDAGEPVRVESPKAAE